MPVSLPCLAFLLIERRQNVLHRIVESLRVLTYMSIRSEWQKQVAEGELFRLSPFPGDPSRRTVVASREVNNLVSGEWEEGAEGNRRARLLATLQNIVAGRRIVVCMTPFKARIAILGRLDPIEESIWDIRCQDKPALRVFCRFLEKDVLFALECRPRSIKVDWLNWLPLGDRHSKEWERAIASTKRQWSMHFPAAQFVSGDNLDDYVSNATLE